MNIYLNFQKKIHKRDEIKSKPFIGIDQIESFENNLKEENDFDIKDYFELNPTFKDISTWKTLLDQYILSVFFDGLSKVRSINKFYTEKKTCFSTSPIRLFSCLQKEKEFQYLFN